MVAILWNGASAAADPPLLRYADSLRSYTQGPGAQPGYTTPGAAIGQPSTAHTPTAPTNNDPNTGAPLVVSLGQRGSIVLAFNLPVRNQDPSARNPYGYDLLVWGNCFQGGAATTPEFEAGRFHEQGFIEVARADENGEAMEWFLVLPRIFYDPKSRRPAPRDFTPAELLPPVIDELGFFQESGDLSTSASRFDGFADAIPAQGSALAAAIADNTAAGVVLDNPATYAIEGLGGTGVDLFRAVRESSPGIPALTNEQVEFVYPSEIDLVRITDARSDDVNPGGAGPITTEVDGVIVLPDMRDCRDPFADADGDGDADLDDFGAFQQCLTGAGPGQITPACSCFDRDGDGDVDTDGADSDLAAFSACATRSGVAANPGCGS